MDKMKRTHLQKDTGGGKSKSKTMSATWDVSVTVIDDAIIYSTKSPEIMKKIIAADNGAQPTPPYQPSEYKLKRLALKELMITWTKISQRLQKRKKAYYKETTGKGKFHAARWNNNNLQIIK